MSWLQKLFGTQPKPSSLGFKRVDWLEIESRWRAIETLAASNAQAELKQAIIQADMLVDRAMKEATVPGASFADRLKFLRSKLSPDVYHGLWRAHLKRNELVHDLGSHIERWEVDKFLPAYQAAIAAFRRLR